MRINKVLDVLKKADYIELWFNRSIVGNDYDLIEIYSSSGHVLAVKSSAYGWQLREGFRTTRPVRILPSTAKKIDCIDEFIISLRCCEDKYE